MPHGGSVDAGDHHRFPGGDLGAFSLTKQAVQLGYCPRGMWNLHTSEREVGQIYVPNVNWMLLGAVVALVVGFRSSSALASAYGIAVTLTMMIDTVLAFVVVRALWRWRLGWAVAFVVLFLSSISPSSAPTA